jgi:hypothetical protein
VGVNAQISDWTEMAMALESSGAAARAAGDERAAEAKFREGLELARMWWETWPERFQSLVARLGGTQIVYGHAMAESGQARTGYPVPTVVVRANEELETSVRVLYISIRDGRLRFRFQLNAAAQPAPEGFETTFISDKTAHPILSALATCSVDCEYRMDAELSEELAEDWASLKVMDRMPFRLILRTDNDGR